jgi:hypothetical protein
MFITPELFQRLIKEAQNQAEGTREFILVDTDLMRELVKMGGEIKDSHQSTTGRYVTDVEFCGVSFLVEESGPFLAPLSTDSEISIDRRNEIAYALLLQQGFMGGILFHQINIENLPSLSKAIGISPEELRKFVYLVCDAVIDHDLGPKE